MTWNLTAADDADTDPASIQSATTITVKSKVVPYWITGVGHGADPSFLVVSPQVT